jgi:putative cell wall-binding protein
MTVDQEQRNPRTTIRLKGQAFADKVKELIHEGNVRRIVIKNESNHTVMEIPVTAGVVAAVVAPIVTAVGAIAALANEWSIEVDHREEPPTDVTVVEGR